MAYVVDENSGWTKATSGNLPSMDIFMVAEFFKNDDRFNSPEIRGVKASCNTRREYGDSAIGYVKLKREGNVCFLNAIICPEHKVKNKGYVVNMRVNEEERKILNVTCEDCPAAKGGCKHALAFLFWVHRRNEEPSPTEVACYWTKPLLATLGTSLKYIKATDLTVNPRLDSSPQQPNNFLEMAVKFGVERRLKSQLLNHSYSFGAKQQLSLYQMAIQYQRDQSKVDFIEFARLSVSAEVITKAEKDTRNQNSSPIWHELRYGRITGSKLNEISRCSTCDGSLVATILGGVKFKPTTAMKRGIELEGKVLSEVEKLISLKIEPCGFFIVESMPIFGASPDGITNDYVVEVKCPTSSKTFAKYVKDGRITEKYQAQLHLQMLAAKKEKGLFCVADPNFIETNLSTCSGVISMMSL